jgi:uroporphyrinogen decarboxylase
VFRLDVATAFTGIPQSIRDKGKQTMRKLPEDTMSARERVMGTINGEAVDRVPIFDLIQHKELMEHVTGEKLTLGNGMDLLLRTIRDRLDTTRGVAPPSPERTWTSDDGFVYKGEWWTTWLVERPFSDTVGALEFVRREIDKVEAAPAENMWSFMGESDVWGQGTQDPNERYRQMQEQLGDVVLFPSESPVGLDTAFYRLGMELFSYCYMEDPDLISRWLEALATHEIARVHTCANADLAPVALVYTDLANKNSPMFSPTFLRAEFFPRLTRLTEAWHAHGVKVIYHSDGDYRMILDDFKAAGVDGINPIEPLENVDHLKETREGWPEFTLMGGIDCSNLLCFASKDEVRAAVKHALDVTKPGGRYILGSSTELHPACKLENILEMWDAALEYGRNG